MATNVYKDFRDEVCEGMVNSAIARQKAGGTANQIPRFSDNTKPPLRPKELPPMRIGKTSDWPKKLHLTLPE